MTWILWTIRASLLAYVLSIALRPTIGFKTWRLLWSGAWSLCLVHVALAFHFVHDWSHAQAVAQTAADTHGWSLEAEFNYVDDFDDSLSPVLQYGNGTRRFLVFFDLNGDDDLTITTFGTGGVLLPA